MKKILLKMAQRASHHKKIVKKKTAGDFTSLNLMGVENNFEFI